MWFLPPAVCGFFLLLIPVWIVIARRSAAIRQVLKSGWLPVILAMSISRSANMSQRPDPKLLQRIQLSHNPDQPDAHNLVLSLVLVA